MADPTQPSQLVNLYCLPATGGCGLSETVRLNAGYHEFTFICPDCMHQTPIGIHVPVAGSIDPATSTVYAFGDESSCENVIVYGLVVIPESRLPVAEQFLSALKQRYSVDPQAEFHCKEVFHGDTRRESAWEHLSETQVSEFAEDLILGLAPFSAGFVVGGVHRNEYPTQLPAVDKFPAGIMDTKQLTGMVCSAALASLSNVYDQSRIRFQADPDRTKVPFFDRKIQAHKLYQMTRSDTNQQITPELLDADNRPNLLQVADLFAYTAAHALADEKGRYTETFRRLYRMCNPIYSFIVYELPPQPSRLELRHAKIIDGQL